MNESRGDRQKKLPKRATAKPPPGGGESPTPLCWAPDLSLRPEAAGRWPRLATGENSTPLSGLTNLSYAALARHRCCRSSGQLCGSPPDQREAGSQADGTQVRLPEPSPGDKLGNWRRADVQARLNILKA